MSSTKPTESVALYTTCKSLTFTASLNINYLAWLKNVHPDF